MSYIDTFDHEFVGWFGGLPLYHPLEEVPATPGREEDFACGPNNLVIGGGSGEHPGLVVQDLNFTALQAIRWHLNDLRESIPAEDYLRLAADSERYLPVEVVGENRDGNVFEFAGWTAADHAEFEERVRSLRFNHPYDSNEHSTVEEWLAVSIGEFVLFSMPDLLHEPLREVGRRLAAAYWRAYENVTLPPPGYHIWGRRERPHQGGVIWGISAWEVKRILHPITVRDKTNGDH